MKCVECAAPAHGLSDCSHPPPLPPRRALLLPLNGLPGSSAWLPSPSSTSLSWPPCLLRRPPPPSPIFGRSSRPDRPPSFCLEGKVRWTYVGAGGMQAHKHAERHERGQLTIAVAPII